MIRGPEMFFCLWGLLIGRRRAPDKDFEVLMSTDVVWQSCRDRECAVAPAEVLREAMASFRSQLFRGPRKSIFCGNIDFYRSHLIHRLACATEDSLLCGNQLSLHALRAEIWLTVYRAHLHCG